MKPECTCGNSEVIENTAMEKVFFYCRGCKTEVVATLNSEGARVKDEMSRIRSGWNIPTVHGNGQPMVVDSSGQSVGVGIGIGGVPSPVPPPTPTQPTRAIRTIQYTPNMNLPSCRSGRSDHDWRWGPTNKIILECVYCYLSIFT